MSEQLREAVRCLAKMREQEEKAKAKLNDLKREAFKIYEKQEHVHAIAKQKREEAEEEVRTLARNYPVMAGEVDGVEVVNSSTLEYNPVEAFHFAVDHRLYMLLELDIKQFEKVIRDLCPPDMWSEIPMKRTRISKNLSQYLEESSDDGQ